MGASSEVLLEVREEVRPLEDPVPPEFVREFQQSTIHRPVPQEFLEAVVSESLELPARVWRDYMEGAALRGFLPPGPPRTRCPRN
jgi:non-heme chloroperoxidase